MTKRKRRPCPLLCAVLLRAGAGPATRKCKRCGRVWTYARYRRKVLTMTSEVVAASGAGPGGVADYLLRLLDLHIDWQVLNPGSRPAALGVLFLGSLQNIVDLALQCSEDADEAGALRELRADVERIGASRALAGR